MHPRNSGTRAKSLRIAPSCQTQRIEGYVEALNFSEAVAYLRIGVARRACEVPELLAAIRAGDLHLTDARLLVPHLTTGNAREQIAAGAVPEGARSDPLGKSYGALQAFVWVTDGA